MIEDIVITFLLCMCMAGLYIVVMVIAMVVTYELINKGMLIKYYDNYERRIRYRWRK